MTESLDFGFVEGTMPGKWLRRWHERHPDIPIIEHPVTARDQLDALVGGGVRVLLGRDLTRTDAMHVIELYVEDMCVAAPRDHVVTAFDAVTLADLADEVLLEPGDVSVAALLDVVASGAGLALVPTPVARAVSNRDIALRPVIDAEPTRVGVAWWSDDDDPVVEEFIGVLRGRTAGSSRQPLADAAAAGTPKSAGTKGGAETKGGAGTKGTSGTGRGRAPGASPRRAGGTRGRGGRGGRGSRGHGS